MCGFVVFFQRVVVFHLLGRVSEWADANGWDIVGCVASAAPSLADALRGTHWRFVAWAVQATPHKVDPAHIRGPGNYFFRGDKLFLKFRNMSIRCTNPSVRHPNPRGSSARTPTHRVAEFRIILHQFVSASAKSQYVLYDRFVPPPRGVSTPRVAHLNEYIVDAFSPY